ncbi:MAG: hypothetical protein F4152_05515 [Dehalococcoidia bacterium]|nr:hypothetical protein [Dehalococcoidia bacterium]
MSRVIEHLESFNRKERFHLLRTALGEDTFTLEEGFRTCLGEKIGAEVPSKAFVAMDYHLDWLQMALYLAANPSSDGPIPNPDNDLFEGSQRDIDLVVAFDEGAKTHLVLVEAKLETGWSNSQLRCKAKRLCRIFGTDRPGAALVTPHFVLTSPRESKNIDAACWPEWMKPGGEPLWMELPKPWGLLKVTRGTEDSGTVQIERIPDSP